MGSPCHISKPEESCASHPTAQCDLLTQTCSPPWLLLEAHQFCVPRDSHEVIWLVCPDMIHRRLKTRMPFRAEHMLPGIVVVQMAGTFFCQEKHLRARSTAPRHPRREQRCHCPPESQTNPHAAPLTKAKTHTSHLGYAQTILHCGPGLPTSVLHRPLWICMWTPGLSLLPQWILPSPDRCDLKLAPTLPCTKYTPRFRPQDAKAWPQSGVRKGWGEGNLNIINKAHDRAAFCWKWHPWSSPKNESLTNIIAAYQGTGMKTEGQVAQR